MISIVLVSNKSEIKPITGIKIGDLGPNYWGGGALLCLKKT